MGRCLWTHHQSSAPCLSLSCASSACKVTEHMPGSNAGLGLAERVSLHRFVIRGADIV